MNGIVNKFLLAGDKFMPERKKKRKLKKQEIQDIFIKMN